MLVSYIDENGILSTREATAEEEAQYLREPTAEEEFYAEINASLTMSKKLELFLESIPVLPRPQNREGYLWKPIYNAEGNVFGWEEIQDPYYQPTHKGTYTDPIPYTEGMAVQMYTDPDPFNGNGWYSFDGDVKVCIKSGVPVSFDDAEFFAYSVE